MEIPGLKLGTASDTGKLESRRGWYYHTEDGIRGVTVVETCALTISYVLDETLREEAKQKKADEKPQ